MAKESKQSVSVKKGEAPVQRAVPARMMSPWDEFDRLFSRLPMRNWMHPLAWESPLFGRMFERMEMKMPAVDVIDRDNDVLVRAEVPGVDKKDLDVSMSGNTLTIKGSVSHETKEEKGDYHRCEISRGAFSRTVTLPTEVNADKISATLKDGILEITLPKIEQSKRRSITVE